jgi:hypothetical protein
VTAAMTIPAANPTASAAVNSPGAERLSALLSGFRVAPSH